MTQFYKTREEAILAAQKALLKCANVNIHKVEAQCDMGLHNLNIVLEVIPDNPVPLLDLDVSVETLYTKHHQGPVVNFDPGPVTSRTPEWGCVKRLVEALETGITARQVRAYMSKTSLKRVFAILKGFGYGICTEVIDDIELWERGIEPSHPISQYIELLEKRLGRPPTPTELRHVCAEMGYRFQPITFYRRAL